MKKQKMLKTNLNFIHCDIIIFKAMKKKSIILATIIINNFAQICSYDFLKFTAINAKYTKPLLTFHTSKI